MLDAGAQGFVLKASAFRELAAAIRCVVAHQVYLSPALATRVARDRSGDRTLSPRERDVLRLMADGKSTKEIAVHLQVSVKTIESHRRNLMAKLDLDNVAQLTKYAVREGITVT
jgi:DNA-binding NarL/FixJ family response regulator